MSCCQDEEKLAHQFRDESIDLGLIKEVLDVHRGETGSLITVLQKTQEVYGFLPLSALKHIADQMQIKPAKVYGVATFYTQFRLKPTGKYVVLLCQGTACHVNGAERILTALNEELNIEPGETTSDGLFTLDTAACLGCCSLSPVMMVNGRAYGPLTPESATKIIKEIYVRETQSNGEGEDI